MTSLSVTAKEFVPNPSNDHKKLRSSLSADVPEFVPRIEKVAQARSNNATAVIKKKSNLKPTISSREEKTSSKPDDTNDKEKNKKEELQEKNKHKLAHKKSKEHFNPRHDTDWAKDSGKFSAESLSPRHDHGWFHRDTSDVIKKEPVDSVRKQVLLRKSDSYNISLSQKSISLRTKAERKKLVQTFSLEYAKQERKSVTAKNSYQVPPNGTQDKTASQPRVSWSAVVKTAPVKERLGPKSSNSLKHSNASNSDSPNTGHSRDLRTKSYDLERDKRMKLNKLKKTASVLGTLDDQSTPSKTALSKRFSHQLLSESRSVGSYDFMLGARPKTNIQRKSLVLQAKLSAGLRQDPKMDNWFDKEIPKSIERASAFRTEDTSTDDQKPEPDKPKQEVLGKKSMVGENTDNLVKRKLTRTTRKAFSPLLKDTEFSRSLNDDYFMSEKYDADSHKRQSEERKLNDKELENAKQRTIGLQKKSLIRLDSAIIKQDGGEKAKPKVWNNTIAQTSAGDSQVKKSLSGSNGPDDEGKKPNAWNIVQPSSADSPFKKAVSDSSAEKKKSNKEEQNHNAWSLGEPSLSEAPSVSGALSYSAMLKKKAPLSVQNRPEVEKAPEKKPLTGEEIRLRKKAKKKEKKQRKREKKIEEMAKLQTEGTSPAATEKKSTPQIRQSQKEISLDISDMFDKLLATSSSSPSKQGKKNKQKKTVISTGVISVVSGLAKKNTPDGKRSARNKYGGTGVIMDGATPIVKRGKERQTPKKKKPTLLKKIIKAERERKRALLEKEKQPTPSETGCEPEGADQKQDEVTTNEETMKTEPPLEQRAETTPEVVKAVESHPPVPLTDVPDEICKQIHSRKFREYCDHVLLKEINNLAHELLITLQKYQDRVYHENQIKFKQKRRFVLGLREVLKHLKLKRIKAIVFAPNLERISSEGGLDDYLRSIISLCKEFEIPKIFAMNRHALGKTLKKKAPVSVVGIFNYDGAQDIFKELLKHVEEAKKAYQEKVRNAINQSGQENSAQQQQQHRQPQIPQIEEGSSVVAERYIQYSPHQMLTHNSEAEQLKQRMLSNFSKEEFVI